jgi:hypothetical protein
MSPTGSPAINSSSSDGPSTTGLNAPRLAKLTTYAQSNGGSSTATSSFVLLGNAAVTATDAIITGDVGTFEPTPTGAVVLTNSPLTGTVHVGDAVAVQAYNDFVNAYNAITLEPGDILLTGTLAGVTLAPGSYYFDAAATLTGVLTLDGPANGVWIFKIGTGGTGALTGTSFQVVMAGGGTACNVTWWVAEAVTMTASDFQGNILAGAAITMTGGSFHGNASSQAGVTVTGPMDVTGCEASNGNGNGNGNGDGNGNGNGDGNCDDHGHGHDKDHHDQGVGNGPDGGDPGNSNNHHGSNDEDGGTPGDPGRGGKDHHDGNYADSGHGHDNGHDADHKDKSKSKKSKSKKSKSNKNKNKDGKH